MCSLRARSAWSASGPKLNFDKISVPARPAWTRLVVSRQPLYVTQRRGPELLSAVAGLLSVYLTLPGPGTLNPGTLGPGTLSPGTLGPGTLNPGTPGP